MTDTAPMTAPEGQAAPMAAAATPEPAPLGPAAGTRPQLRRGCRRALARPPSWSRDDGHRRARPHQDAAARPFGTAVGKCDRARPRRGRPVDVLINDNLLAHGEVVVLDEEFGVRILDIVMTDGQPRSSLSLTMGPHSEVLAAAAVISNRDSHVSMFGLLGAPARSRSSWCSWSSGSWPRSYDARACPGAAAATRGQPASDRRALAAIGRQGSDPRDGSP